MAGDDSAAVAPFDHAQRTAAPPRHHRGPFDRLQVTRAQAERLTPATHDREL